LAQSLSHFWKGEKVEISKKVLLGLLLCAFLLRLPVLLFPEVIRLDGAEYIRHARLILSGDWTGGKAPPLYPALISFAHLFSTDLEQAGILVSFVFGVLLVLPVVYLGREIFDERVGLLSGVIVVVHPFLNSFSGSVMTESTYYFLVATIVLTGWYAFQKGRVREAILFGLLTSLAYLTRPEGIGFLIVFCLWVLAVGPLAGKRNWTRRIGIVLLALLGFLLLSSPYLIEIRKETGRWGITKKFAIILESSSNENGSQTIEAFTKKKEISLLALVKNPLVVVQKVFFGFFHALYVFQQAYNPLLFFFALLALIFFRSIPVSAKANLYLFAYVFFFLGLVLPFLWVAQRYASYMIPVAIPWAAFGFMHSTRWLSARAKGGFLKEKIPLLLVIILVIGLYVQGWPALNRDFRMIQKEVGLWMRDHLPKGQKMMSKMGQESFYAEQAWVKLPEKGYEEILKEARARGARYLVVDEAIEKDSPGFLQQAKNGEVKPLFELKRKNRFMIVFEVVPSREN
jgi:4-amino-4-deoxy-L-arabinose transferase-like glycosyltransferase